MTLARTSLVLYWAVTTTSKSLVVHLGLIQSDLVNMVGVVTQSWYTVNTNLIINNTDRLQA